MRKKVLIMFGGVSSEHDVSIITGLQVIENIDLQKYDPHVVYVNAKGKLEYLSGLKHRSEFFKVPRKPIALGRDDSGGYVVFSGLFRKKIYPYAAYLAFHGGKGEGGGIQGLLESLNIPHTSTSQEGSVIVMNKQLTKDQVKKVGVSTVSGVSLFSENIKIKLPSVAKSLKTELGLPVIIKPAHFGSSIGIKVAKTLTDLEYGLQEATLLDNEIVVEKYLTDFTEYNCAVRKIGNNIEVSEIEKPVSHDEILSFADKYQRGSKKTGQMGMASLQRVLPAKINDKLKREIQGQATKAYEACRCKGMVRVDFMVTKTQIFLTEINPIPGSMAYYLWEATGIPFKQQISNLIEQSVSDAEVANSFNINYSSDIVEKFVSSNQ